MLRKRIIFTLIYANGYFHQSRNFKLQRVGDINWLEKNYNFKNIAFSLDELIVLNASKNKKDIKEFANILTKLVDDVFIPISAGGGIQSLDDAKMLFENGADKIVLNSSLFENENLIKTLVSKYGSQSIIASIDYIKNDNIFDVMISNGTKKVNMPFENYLEYIQNLEVGEIYLNSIGRDGTGFGYDLEIINKISKYIKIPLIIAGGAGNDKHLIEGLKIEHVDAVATANLFNFIGNGLPNARSKIIEEKMNIAKWK